MIAGREPAAISAFISAVIALAITFGLHLTVEQVGAIMTVVVLGLGLFVRQSSTPTAAPKLPVGTAVLVDRPAGQPDDTPPPDAVVALRSQLKAS